MSKLEEARQALKEGRTLGAVLRAKEAREAGEPRKNLLVLWRKIEQKARNYPNIEKLKRFVLG